MTLVSEIGIAVVGTLFMAAYGVILGLILFGIDRIVHARMQARIGPPIHQPFLDVMKLFCKDSPVPDNAIPWLFNAAPVVAVASAITILLYLPIGSFVLPLFGGYGDIILIMYLLTVPSLAMVVGGFASGSPYATIGSQREMVTMMAYEFPLAIAIIAIAWRLAVAGVADPFSIVTIASNPVWGVVGPVGLVGLFLLFIVLAWVTPAELSRIPCDTPEAETELCGGLLVEYSGRNLAMFSVSSAVKTVAMASLAVVMFLPWNLSWFIPMAPAVALVVDFIFFTIKVLLVVLFSVTLIRTSMARFRINHLMKIYWGLFGGIGLIGLILIMIDVFIGGGVVA